MIDEYVNLGPDMPRPEWPRLEQLNKPALPMLAKRIGAGKLPVRTRRS